MSIIPKIEIEDDRSFVLEHDYYNPEPEPEKPGYCSNPFLRLNQLMEIPEDSFVQSLYGYALDLENLGNAGDFEEQLAKLTLVASSPNSCIWGLPSIQNQSHSVRCCIHTG